MTGRGGADLHQRWGQDPTAYLGITVPDFPNLFCLYGPNTNLVVNGSIVMFSECAVHYVMECLRLLLERGHQVMDLHPEVLESYQAVIDEANAAMAWGIEGVDNWYKSASGRVSQNWPLATIEYWDLTRRPDPVHYDFILLSRTRRSGSPRSCRQLPSPHTTTGLTTWPDFIARIAGSTSRAGRLRS